jgi:hypothetical protein
MPQRPSKKTSLKEIDEQLKATHLNLSLGEGWGRAHKHL